MTVIAIDGPSGSGKSTVAKAVAKKIDYLYLDTGAMYRAMTYQYLKKDCNLETPEGMKIFLLETKLSFSEDKRILLNGEEVDEYIRTPEVTNNVSYVCAFKEIRDTLTAQQREFGEKYFVVMDGRDIGTTVFPKAELKIYLTADIEERAKRRQKDFEAEGIKYELSEVIDTLQKRDSYDSTREVSPLKKADDAIEIDSTNMSIEEVVDKITTLIRGVTCIK